jgi:hypothetical protein
MTKDEELNQLREENTALRAQVAWLNERLSVLEAQQAKDSHNSHLPPSSDRFHRQPKSLRKKSGKKPGGQTDHPGSTLQLERRQVVDLPPKRVLVIEHQAQQKCCPLCQQVSAASFPQEVRAPVQYGAALGAIGILADFAGVSVHDGWSSYWQFLCQHALCNVHHLRELTYLDEEQQQVWAGQMKELLLHIKAAVEQARAQGRSHLHPLEVADWKARYQALLAEGYLANPPPDPPAQSGKKGRRKQAAARNLLDRLSKYPEAVLAFLDNFAVPFDNSLAERDIRMVKVQQKVSGCFRSASGAPVILTEIEDKVS